MYWFFAEVRVLPEDYLHSRVLKKEGEEEIDKDVENFHLLALISLSLGEPCRIDKTDCTCDRLGRFQSWYFRLQK